MGKMDLVEKDRMGFIFRVEVWEVEGCFVSKLERVLFMIGNGIIWRFLVFWGWVLEVVIEKFLLEEERYLGICFIGGMSS